jgi:hypothetical protein
MNPDEGYTDDEITGLRNSMTVPATECSRMPLEMASEKDREGELSQNRSAFKS